MTEAQFRDSLGRSIARLAADLESRGARFGEKARLAGAQELAELLPRGRRTPHGHILIVARGLTG